MTDFVTVDECEAEAVKQMEERYPEGGTLQPPWREFVINFAANVAHKCAVEATKRARLDEPKVEEILRRLDWPARDEGNL